MAVVRMCNLLLILIIGVSLILIEWRLSSRWKLRFALRRRMRYAGDRCEVPSVWKEANKDFIRPPQPPSDDIMQSEVIAECRHKYRGPWWIVDPFSLEPLIEPLVVTEAPLVPVPTMPNFTIATVLICPTQSSVSTPDDIFVTTPKRPMNGTRNNSTTIKRTRPNLVARSVRPSRLSHLLASKKN